MPWTAVSVEFLSPDAGGRPAPTGAEYACTARFTTPDGERPEWSVVVNLTQSPPGLRFLVEAAPAHLLVPGFVLELREGRRVVGHATVQAERSTDEGEGTRGISTARRRLRDADVWSLPGRPPRIMEYV